jgi:hypothetical protein
MPASAASLDSVAPSEASWEEDDRLLEQEWQESMEDLQRLFTFVLMPVFGKWLGRSTSHWRESHICLSTLK